MPSLPKQTIMPKDIRTPEMAAAVINNLIDETPQLDGVPRVYAEGQTMNNGMKATRAAALNTLNAVGEVVTQFQANQNAFLGALINRIGRVMIDSRLYQNHWRMFKKGFLEYGETVEEIYVAMAKPYQYDPNRPNSNPFKRHIPDVKSAFHTMNYQKFYPTTVSNDQLRQAFLSWQGISDLIARIIEQVYTGANYDEFLVMKYMVAKLALDGKIYSVNIPAIDKDNARDVTTTMVEYAKNLGYMNSDYNMAGVPTFTDPSSLYMILTSKVQSIFDVNVLALSFNMDKAELIGQITGVDSFSKLDDARLTELFKDDPFTTYTPFSPTELNQLSSIAGLMVDENFFMIFDNFYNMTDIYDPENLHWNYFYHVWKIISASPFANAILFTSDQPAITGVTVSPDTATVSKGQSVQLTATVASTGLAPKSVTWSLTGGTASTIDDTGKVTVGSAETATTLTANATSTYDTTKSATATITVA